MTEPPAFDRTLDARYGEAVQLSPLVRRVAARNPSPFTFTGTMSYLVGRGRVAIVDPGPADAAHVAALLDAVRGETVSHILVTHTHGDHTGALPGLAAATGAVVAGCGPHRLARPLHAGEANPLDAAGDRLYRPDVELRDGEAVGGPGWTLEAVATPGHTANHLAFALAQEESLFSGDHVMAWSTSIVAPPDGAMADYMASLDRLLGRADARYLPGHGPALENPARFVRALKAHRLHREASIMGRLEAGDQCIADIVAATYQGLDPSLTRAAALSVLAHLEDLVERGLVATDGPSRIDGVFAPA